MARLRLFRSRCIRASALVWRLAPLAAFAASLGASTAAHAHGFGQRYELPLPLTLYLAGAAAVVALSFVVFALFVRRAAAPRAPAHLDLLASPIGPIIGHPAVAVALRLAVLVLFLVAILAGLLGDQNPYRNIAPTLVWIIFWVGLAFVAAFAGDLWALINPWRTVYDATQSLIRLRGGNVAPHAPLAYPEALGVWPACLLLLSFSWTELVYPNAASPVHIATLAIAYSALTLAGMVLFGRDIWLRNGEVFSLVFSTFGRFAPIQWSAGRLLLRPFGAGLIEGPPVSPSMIAFVLLLLACVLYDGLIGTGEWALFESGVRALIPAIGDLTIRSLGLVAFWLLFLGAYLGICAAMSHVAAGRPSTSAVAGAFVLTLVPIAIGYHVAHYLVFLLVQGQYIIPLLSDPFGYGWDVFGTAGYRVDIGLVGARFAWYAALTAIVAGHVFALYLAHVRAAVVFEPARLALATQVPLTALMVIYTFVGLSITAGPIVESRLAAEPGALATEFVAIPADAVVPDTRSGRLLSVGPGKSARMKITYRVLGSAFHDGSKTGPADLLYPYAFAYRWAATDNRNEGGHDPHIEEATAALRRQLLGVRVIGVDAASKSFRVGDVNFVREVLTVEVYLSVRPEEPEWSAVLAPPWSTVPWPLLVLMEEAVARGFAAFSQAEAARRGVPWLDLVRDAKMSERLAALAGQFEREGFRPAALHAHVSEEEARRRWRALMAFHKASGHWVVTNGPYRLKGWTPHSVTLEAFRDLTYPLGVGSYDSYAIPRRGFITRAEWDGQRLTVAGDIEVTETFQRSYRLVRMPLRSVPATILKRAAPECRYVVIDASGRIAAAGTALLGADANFEINLAGRLPPGRYALSALIAVNGNVMNPDLHRMELVVSSGR
jgi:hypothetical protein